MSEKLSNKKIKNLKVLSREITLNIPENLLKDFLHNSCGNIKDDFFTVWNLHSMTALRVIFKDKNCKFPLLKSKESKDIRKFVDKINSKEFLQKLYPIPKNYKIKLRVEFE
jgi:hypothetical protein